MIRYFNFLSFFTLLIVFITLGTTNKISTNLHSILPKNENTELVKEFLKLDSNKQIFIASKGFEKESLKELKSFEKELLKIEGIEKKSFANSKEFLEYQKKYYFYLNELDINKVKNLDVKSSLNELYSSIINSFLDVNISKNDPFSLIKEKEIAYKIKNRQLVLNDYGYLSIFTTSNSIVSLQDYERIYDSIKQIEAKNITSFSSMYYFVENSRYIKKDVNKIIILAAFLLLSIYILILKNIKLLTNTLLTLGSSMLISTIILTLFYGQISIFVVVFGLSISTIAIDYMFHHYFHGHYKKTFIFNREVFLGFFTTFFAFFILSFTDFLLIKQITQFTMISLLTSYLVFSFIYTKIEFSQKELFLKSFSFSFLNKKTVFYFSALILFISFNNLTFDLDIRSLDYNNEELKKKEDLFKNKLNHNRQFVLIKAKTIDKLISYNEQIKQIDTSSLSSLDKLISKENFIKKQKELSKAKLNSIKEELNKHILNTPLKKESFKNAYNYKIEAPKYDYEKLISYNIPIGKYKNEFISYISISDDKVKEIIRKDFVYPLNLKILFEEDLQKNINQILKLGLLSLCFIILVIILISKRKMIHALNFILFPSALIFLYLSSIEINILHLFMFFIILAISIDYAIYSSKDNSIQTKKAILFSALSSFAGFGVLILSNIASLFSIGSVASLGILGILILILLQKEINASKYL